MNLDFLKQELEIGDYVIFLAPNYRDLNMRKVVKLYPKSVQVEGFENKIHSSKVVKVNEQLAYARDTYAENWV
jgi:hypothetical protein